MSTSLLYHGFDIKGYSYVRTRYVGGSVIFTVERNRHDLSCPVCNSRDITLKGGIDRKVRALPIGKKPVFINFSAQRVSCRRCGTIRQAEIGFATHRRSYTKAFERYALELSKHMTILDVAKHLGVGWDLVKEIQKRNLGKKYAKPSLEKIERIAIDEICIGKGHRYLTVVLDLTTGAVVFVGEGKGADALIPFRARIKRCKNSIEAVAIDMSTAYISAVITNLPKAAIVFDHFHVIKLYNDRLTELRRDLHREAQGPLQKEVLKGTRWLLLKNPENLDDELDERKRLEEALELNKPLATAYCMKDELRLIRTRKNKSEARKLLDNWIEKAWKSGIRMLVKFGNTLAAHAYGILNYYDHPISTGPLEGTNNKIKTLQRRSYGFRDREFFKLKIFALHETRYALVG